MAAVSAEQMLRALAAGLFPMAPSHDSGMVDWIEPRTRGVMPIDGFHVSGTLRQKLRTNRFDVTVDEAFNPVVAACAELTSARTDTWISPQLQTVFATLHDRKFAHSLECWRQGVLVGGIFGVALGGLFTIESMFHAEADASKVAFACLMVRLRLGGFRLADCQFYTSHLASLGAVAVDQSAYRVLLKEALLAGGVRPEAPLTPPSASGVDFSAQDRMADFEPLGVKKFLDGRIVAAQLARPSA